jgi:hypothetical protein
VNTLPPNLETLNLRVILRQGDAGLPTESGPPSKIDNILWMSHFIGLVRNVGKKLPSLKNIGILIQGRDWPEAEDSFLFQDIVEECSNACLKLKG